MRHLLEEVDSGHSVALKACRHFVSDYNLARNRTVIREKWGSLPLGSQLLPPDLEPCHWSSTFTERLARFVRTGIPRCLGEAALRQSMKVRIEDHKAKRVGFIEELTSADINQTILRVFPAGTKAHLDLSESFFNLI